MYPEHEKMAKIKDQSQAISEFLDWLVYRGYIICEYYTEKEEGDWYSPLYRTDKGISDLLAEYFEIDLRKLEEERQKMLARARQDLEEYVKF